jgi:Domain of unknown function (DUF4149)
MATRQLLALFDVIYLLSMTAMVGSILFFSFAVAPIIFRVLGEESGGRFVRALFPRYYQWGAISGAIALPAYVAGPLCFPEYRGIAVGLQSAALLVCTLVMLYCGNSLVPQINRARDDGPTGHSRFVRLHRRSVWLNMLVMVLGIVLLAAFAARPVPRTEGIVELSPVERARREFEAYNAKRKGAEPSSTEPRDGPAGSARSGGP